MILLPARGQMRLSDDPPEITHLFNLIYNYKLSEAEKFMNTLKLEKIGPDLMDLSRINLLWWQMISGDTTRDPESQIHLVIDQIVDRLTKKPIGLLTDNEVFTLVHAMAYKTRVYIFTNEYLKGIFNLKKTVDYLNFALNHADRYDKFMLLSGLYNYFAAVTIENNRIFTPFFSLAPKSDKKLGYKQLIACTNLSNLLLSTEARYFLMKANLEIEEEPGGASHVCQELVVLFPDNLIFRYHLLRIMVDGDRLAEASIHYQELKSRSLSLPGLTSSQRSHLIDEADRYLRKKRVKQFI